MAVRWSAFRAIAAWAAIGLFAFALACNADVKADLVSGDQEASPGSYATSVFSIANTGAAELTALLEFSSPTGWQVPGAQEALTLFPGEEGTVFATIVVPEDARAGEYEVTLTAISQANPADRSTSVVVIRVAPINEIELIAPNGRSGAPGASIEYEVTVVNRGNSQDTVVLAADSSRQLKTELSPPNVDLAPQERATIQLRLALPPEEQPGQDVLTITATSTLYAGVKDDAVIFTTILPPTPDAVGGTLMEILSGRLRLSIHQDVFSGDFGSLMSFSTSGRVLDGYFSSFLSASHPLGPDPFEVTSYSILYRQEPTTTTLGTFSRRLTDLVSLTCEGGSVEVDEDLFSLIAVAGLDGDEARFGGRLTVGPEVANVGLAYFEARSPTSRQAIAGASAVSEPLEDWRILTEAALGTDDGQSSLAFLFTTQIDTSSYFLDGEVFSIGTYFPGSGRDSAGIRLSQRLRLTDLSLSLSLSHVWDNVVQDPVVATQINDAMGFNISATPIEDGPRLSSTVQFGWAREDDPTQSSEIDLLLAAGARETEGVFPYTFSGEIADQIDQVLGTHTRTLTFSEGAGLSVDSFYLFLQLTQEKHVDVISDSILSGATDVSFLFRPEGTLHEATISLRNTEDSLDLSASFFIRFLDGLDIAFDGTIGWDRADASPVSFGWGVAFTADLAVPLPFLVTRGRIEGHLFVDVDGDGTFGAADLPVAGGILATNGTEVATDADGRFRFPPLPRGTYSLTVSRLPADTASPETAEARVTAGETTIVEIPLRPTLIVGGTVFDDVDQDGKWSPEEGGFADVRVLVAREGETLLSATTNALGRFTIVDVPPGLYAVSLDPATLPARFASTTPEELVIDLTAAGIGPIEFGAYIRPRETIITFQPPTADFSVSPEAPVAGEPVTFDGTLSIDFDGEIVAYTWDFDADGSTDAADPIAEWTFVAPGDADVTLTVIDNAGNQDTTTRTVPIGGETAPGETTTSPSFQPPIADFSFSPEQPEVAEPVNFDGALSVDFDGQIVAYDWDFDADERSDATGAAALRAFSVPGTYDVTLTVTDDGGNTDALTRSIDIGAPANEPVDLRPSLRPPTARFSYTPGEPIAGEPITFDGSSSTIPDGEIGSYAWDFDGDGASDASGQIVEYTFAVAGLFAVELTVADVEGESDTVSFDVDVAAAEPLPAVDSGPVFPPIADFIYEPEAPIAGEPIEFNGMVSFDFDGEIMAYAWDFENDGIIDSTAPIVPHVFAAAGSFDVRLTVTDADSATDSIVRTLSVQ